MNIIFTSKKIDLSTKFKDKVDKKLSKLQKFFGDDVAYYIRVNSVKDFIVLELTVKTNQIIFRSERTSTDKYQAFDDALDIIVRQIKKNKSKLEKRFYKVDNSIRFNTEYIKLDENNNIEEDIHKVVRYKKFFVKPMDSEEAILQMELLGHSFFMFRNSSNNQINVVYKRKDGDYAILESEV
ncbi:MAG: ribosome-associated translation inhibitor RaiA [Oscillospiraceae bacterium]|nr:ribosome-associated translation inhibitor RaiA [Oscillospiraceae bacterium]